MLDDNKNDFHSAFYNMALKQNTRTWYITILHCLTRSYDTAQYNMNQKIKIKALCKADRINLIIVKIKNGKITLNSVFREI